MNLLRFDSHCEADTDRFAAHLAEQLTPACVVGLVGTLGAGKTRLVQAVARALGAVHDEVTSPTFVLINEYQSGRLPLYHCDMYRIRDEDELSELGLEEYFAGDGVTLVEWADRFADCLPSERLTVEIESLGPQHRQFTVRACGTKYLPFVQDLASRIEQEVNKS